MKIQLLLTGGTISKHYNELNGTLEIDNRQIYDMLEKSRLTIDVQVHQLLQKDSLDMTQSDRDTVTEACRNSKEARIVIIHGTDTMPDTARTLFEARLDQKVIVLTGAMIPYSFGVSSDAMFNLGTAIAFAQTLLPGVYIAMNGRYFKANQVRKDRSVGKFLET